MRFVTLLVALLVLPFGSHGAIRFGMPATGGPVAFYEKATRHGADGHASVYWTLGSDTLLATERTEYQEGTELIEIIKFPEIDGSVLQAILDGVFDEQIRSLGQRIRAAGRPLTLRAFYEFNGSWYVWHVYHPSNDPEDFVPAYRRFVNLIRREAGDLVTFDLNYNRRSNDGSVRDFSELYPGDDFVDTISFSSYNRCGSREDFTENRTFAEEVQPAYNAVREFTNKPVAVAETGTTDFCGTDKIVWYRDLIVWCIEVQCQNVTFFFERVGVGEASNDVPIYWGVDEADISLFRALLEQYRMMAAEGREAEFAAAPLPDPLPEPDPISLPAEQAPKLATPPTDTDEASAATEDDFSLERKDGPEWRFAGWAELAYPLTGIAYNSGLSSVTGEPFGSKGATVRGNFRFGPFWQVNEDTDFGISFITNNVFGANGDEYWNRRLAAGLEVGWYFDTKGDRVDYSNTSFTLRCLGFHHYVAVPDDFKKNGVECGAYLTHVWGGRIKN